MMKKTFGLGIAVVALAGGVMYCSDAFETADTETRRYDDDTNVTGPEVEPDDSPRPTAMVDWTFGSADAAKPSFYAIKSGEGPWRHPDPKGNLIRFSVEDEQGRYTLAMVCETEDVKGKKSAHTIMVEATVRELSAPRVTCSAPATDRRTVQLAGVVRNTNGRDVTVAIGTQTVHVENEKKADDVMFTADVPPGRNAVLAMQGTGEKTLIAAARDVRFEGETGNVEIDMNDAEQTVPADIPLASDGTSYLAGGQAFVWFDGRTRYSVGPVNKVTVEDDPVIEVRTTQKAVDVLDLRLDFRNKMPFMGTEPKPVAHVRFMRSASTPIEMILPALSFTEETAVKIDNETIEVGWKVTNWAAFGYASDDDFALFIPTAYVARFSQEDTMRRTLDVVVTPLRASGPNPVYEFENPADTAGFEDRWLFRPSDDVHIQAGNLTAYAHDEHVDTSDAIAAYLDSGSENGPGSYLHTRSLTTVVAGDGVDVVDESIDLTEYFKEECMMASRCIDRVAQTPTHIQDCAALELYRRCGEAEIRADEKKFVDDLEMEIIRYALFDRERMEDGPTMRQILDRISEEKVRLVEPDEPGAEYYPYDPGTYQVFYHPDPIHENSAVLWYGAYLRGRLISIYPVNYFRTDN